MAWIALFMLSGIKNFNYEKPLRQKDLNDKDSDLVKTLLKIYTMESFIVYKLNKTSFDMDKRLLPFYGPYAAALSYIISKGNTMKKEITLYRGM